MVGSSSQEYIRQIIAKLNGRKILILGNHDKIKPLTYVDDLGFESVHTSYVYDGTVKEPKVLMVHDPAKAVVWPKDGIVLCGHIHDLFISVRNVVNVGVDVWDYKPVEIDVVCKKARFET